jgi:hypothetical protein
MLIKTVEFQETLNKQLYQILINTKKKPIFLGSYRLYNTNSYISDIDITQGVNFNDKLIEILVYKLNKLKFSNFFKVIYVECGLYNDIRIPWTIYPDKDQGCNFSLEIALKWLDNIKTYNIITKEDYKYIYDILYKEQLTLGDLIKVEKKINPYLEITWSIPELQRGYKIVRNIRYNIIDEAKKMGQILLMYIFKYKDEYVSIDTGLVDWGYKKPNSTHMYLIYNKHWYKILKEYKKVILPEYKPGYVVFMEQLQIINSIVARIKLIKYMDNYNLTNYNKFSHKHILDMKKAIVILLHKHDINIPFIPVNYNNIIDNLSGILDVESKKKLYYYYPYIKQKEKFSDYIRLATATSYPVPTTVLIDRRKDGNMCPFFPEDINIRLIQVICSKKRYPLVAYLSNDIRKLFLKYCDVSVKYKYGKVKTSKKIISAMSEYKKSDGYDFAVNHKINDYINLDTDLNVNIDQIELDLPLELDTIRSITISGLFMNNFFLYIFPRLKKGGIIQILNKNKNYEYLIELAKSVTIDLKLTVSKPGILVYTRI